MHSWRGKFIPSASFQQTKLSHPLHRIFQQYPALPFLEIYHYILETPTPNRLPQATLLSSAVRAIGDLVNPNFPRVFCALLYARMSWCLDVVEVFKSSLSSPMQISRKGSLASVPALSRTGSISGLASLDAASLSTFASNTPEATLFNSNFVSDDISGPDGMFGGSDLTPEGLIGDGQDTSLQVPLAFTKGQLDCGGAVMDTGQDNFRFLMDVEDPIWNMGV